MEERKPAAAGYLVAAALAVSFLVAVVAALSGDALTWDGAALLHTALDTQNVTLPHARFTLVLFQAPVIWLSHLTSNLRPLALLYGFAYTLVPALSTALSWWLLRGSHPRLLIWQLAWSGSGVLAGQIFYVSECLIALHVVWPLLFVIATEPTRGRLALGAALASVLFGLHPVAGPLLSFAGCLSLASALRDRKRRTDRRLAVAGVALLAAGITRSTMAILDPYDSSQAAQPLSRQWESLRLPALGVAALALAFSAVAVTQIARGRARGTAFVVGTGSLSVAAVAFVPWARDETAWRDALNYRFIAPFVFVPFALGVAAFLLSYPKSRERQIDVLDAALGFGHVALIALVIALQSAGWTRLRHSLEAELARKPDHCFPMWAIPECSDTALLWWPTPAYAIVLQGRSPRSLILAGNDCERDDFELGIQLNPWLLRPREGGWFDMRHAGLPPR